MPMAVMTAYVAFPYVREAWSRLEGSREAGGLAGLYLLKTVILVFCALVALQGLSMMLRSVLVLRGHGELAPRGGEQDGAEGA